MNNEFTPEPGWLEKDMKKATERSKELLSNTRMTEEREKLIRECASTGQWAWSSLAQVVVDLLAELDAVRREREDYKERWVQTAKAAKYRQDVIERGDTAIATAEAELTRLRAELTDARAKALEEAASHVERAAFMPSTGIMCFLLLEVVWQIRALAHPEPQETYAGRTAREFKEGSQGLGFGPQEKTNDI